MLIQFRVLNHRSIRDDQVLKLTASPRSEAPAVSKKRLGASLLRVIGVYGANASGKSNLVAALRFMREAVAMSYRFWKPDGGVPREPFLLDEKSPRCDSEYELDLLVEDVPYTYGFRVDSERVTGEWLYAYPHNRKQVLFTRDRGDTFSFGKNLKGPNRKITPLTRSNSLYLSAAAQNNHQQLQPIYNWITRQIRFIQPGDTALPSAAVGAGFLEDPRVREQVLTLLRASDLGIIDIRVREEPLDEAFSAALEAMVGVLRDRPGSEHGPALRVNKSQTRVDLIHRSADHPEGVSLPFEAESMGTKALLFMAHPLLTSLRTDGVLCVDELDSSLHPRLAREVVAMFQDENRNPNNTQLIFNTHDTSLLSVPGRDGPLLYRDQIWFTEKDDGGATVLYPLSDFHPRKHENLERGYLQGRYGAVPFVESWQLGTPARGEEAGFQSMPEVNEREDG